MMEVEFYAALCQLADYVGAEQRLAGQAETSCALACD
jgi:hypothetical protein